MPPNPLSPAPLTEAAAEALATIATDMVHRVRKDLEQQISQRLYKKARDYIAKVGQNTAVLIHDNRTYAGELGMIQERKRTELTETEVRFLQDHLSLRDAALMSQQMVNKMLVVKHTDVLLLVYCRGLNLRNTFWLHFYQATCSEAGRARLKHDTFFTIEFDQCAVLLRAEIIRILTRIEQLHTASSDVQLENVGPDHEVDSYGRDVYPRDSSSIKLDDRDDRCRCCICLEPYTAAHTAFEITRCKGRHVVGKACLSTWLNGTTPNANTCPQCREELFERRALRPAVHPDNGEFGRLEMRLERALDTLGDFERLRNELFGPDAAAEFLWDVIHGVNYEFFQKDIHFCLDYVGGTRSSLGIRWVSWHN